MVKISNKPNALGYLSDSIKQLLPERPYRRDIRLKKKPESNKFQTRTGVQNEGSLKIITSLRPKAVLKLELLEEFIGKCHPSYASYQELIKTHLQHDISSKKEQKKKFALERLVALLEETVREIKTIESHHISYVKG